MKLRPLITILALGLSVFSPAFAKLAGPAEPVFNPA
jgi:hypothetical protein